MQGKGGNGKEIQKKKARGRLDTAILNDYGKKKHSFIRTNLKKRVTRAILEREEQPGPAAS